MGRKTKLTHEVKEQIYLIIADGNTYKVAFQSCGIGESTFYEWMQQPEFSELIKKAEAEAKKKLLGTIKAASDTKWQAAAWILERRWPDEFGAKQKLDHNVNDRRMGEEEYQAALGRVKNMLRDEILAEEEERKRQAEKENLHLVNG